MGFWDAFIIFVLLPDLVQNAFSIDYFSLFRLIEEITRMKTSADLFPS